TQNDSLQSRLKLDVHVVTTPELEMQTAIARLSGNADLRVRGTADRPAILGRAEVLEGEISFNGNKYHLERGDVTFANPAKTQPIIDLQATTRVRDYDITVQFRGDASVANGLKVTWQSEPQLPETNVVRGPQVTVEQQVASNLTLTYSTNVSVSSQQIIQVEYNITRTISIVALRDQNGVVSFDFKIRRRKK